MNLPRLPDWPERYAAAIEAAFGRPYSLGTWDCGHFVVAVAEALTGVDVGAAWRGSYDSEVGLARLYAELGVRDVAGWADHVMGERIDVRQAQRGDWMLSPATDPMALGVCDGVKALFVSPIGPTWRRSMACAAAWKVGDR